MGVLSFFPPRFSPAFFFPFNSPFLFLGFREDRILIISGSGSIVHAARPWMTLAMSILWSRCLLSRLMGLGDGGVVIWQNTAFFFSCFLANF